VALFDKNRRETLVLFSLLFVISAIVIWVRTETVKATYLYVRQEKQLRELTQDIQSVRVKWLKQTAPSRLEAMAPSFGLYAPNMEQVMKVSELGKTARH
jgi:hypothetical protein